MDPNFTLPNQMSAIYWPVGTADSTTLVLVANEVVMQIDLHHLEKAESDDEPECPIIDYLVKVLPKRNGQPYLAVFALTHPDQDHIRGFAELLRRVQIGELWHTPRIFRDQPDQEALCEDAKAFRKEAHRRRKVMSDTKTATESGDRIRVIGHDDILLEDEYRNLPSEAKSRPADIVTMVDGRDLRGRLQIFIHAPFKEDQAASKNNTSLSVNIVFQEEQTFGQFFFFGDREYLTTKRIFETTEERNNTGYLYWDVLLCSHHCSKAVMHYQGEGESEATFKKDVMDYFEKYKRPNTGYIISSSHSKFTDGDGDNPPHSKARARYEEIIGAGCFICTHEYPNKSTPSPIVFLFDENGVKLQDLRQATTDPGNLSAASAQARGGGAPPVTQVGFG